AHEGDVQLPRAQGGELQRGGERAHLQPDVGEPLPELAHHGGEGVEHDRGREGHAHRSRLAARRPPRRLQRIVHRAEDPLALRQEHPSRVGEPHLAPAPVEERGADQPLQPLDLLRERGLGDPQPRRGAPEVQLLRHRDEVAETAELESRIDMFQISIQRARSIGHIIRGALSWVEPGHGRPALSLPRLSPRTMSTATLPDRDLQTDTFPINGTDYVEFYVGNAKQASHYYRTT